MNENLGIKWIKQLIQADPTTNEDAVREAKKGIQDYLAASFFANREAIPKQLNNSQPFTYGIPNNIINKKQRITFASSHHALVNGFRAHYLDIDDTQPSMRGHASAVILSALFAVAHPDDDGQDFISAYIAGVEIGGRLGNLFNPDLYQKGWHATEFIGGFAATAALIKYLNLNESDATNAFSLVASQAAGFRFQFGTDAKPLQAGIAARNAIEAVDWTLKGVQGSEAFLFGDRGLFEIFEIDQATGQEVLTASWDGDLQICKPGLWFKAYPFCSAAFRAADAAVTIFRTTGYEFLDIEQVTISFNPGRDAALVYTAPTTGLEGKFSAEYITYLGLKKGYYEPADFTTDLIDEDIQAGLTKYTRIITPETDKGLSSTVKVTFKDGLSVQEEVWYPTGSPENPLSNKMQFNKLADSLQSKRLAENIQRDIQTLDQTKINTFLKHINGGNSWDHMH